VKNILSFDLEFWYNSEFISEEDKKEVEDERQLVEEPVLRILDLLDKHNAKATFFVVGKLAEKYPKLIKEIYKRGHEIGSHGYSHKLITKMTKKEFEDEINKTDKIIRKLIGKKPRSFRAPCFSLKKETDWALDVLREQKFKYDSSIFPNNIGFYGNRSAPTKPYFIDKNRKILEIPITPFVFLGLKIQFSGGVHFRIFPGFLIEKMIERMNKKGKGAVIYIHPWETYKIPRVKTSIIGRFITYWGTKSCLKKLERILNKFKFSSIEKEFK